MDWNQIAGKWKQAKGEFKQKWGKLSDDDLDAISGDRDKLLGTIQEKYGVAKDAAERQLQEFQSTLNS